MDELIQARRTQSEISEIGSPSLPRRVAWNNKLEQTAKEIGESSKGYKLMHITEAQRAQTIYNRLMILGIIMGPLSGVASAIGAAINSGTDPTIPIISIIFGFISGIVVAILKFGKYDEVSHANKQAAARYTSIESSVRRQLGLYRYDRIPANSYMDWLETKFEELFQSAPLLPAVAYDKLSNIAEKIGIKVPNQYNTTITINTEYEDDNIKNIDEIVIANKNDVIVEVASSESSNKKEKPLNKTKSVKRTIGMANFSDLGQCSDKMLQYEMERMAGFK